MAACNLFLEHLTVCRICGKSAMQMDPVADASRKSAIFTEILAASACRKQCRDDLPQMRNGRGVRGWEDVVWENGIITIVQ